MGECAGVFPSGANCSFLTIGPARYHKLGGSSPKAKVGAITSVTGVDVGSSI